MDTYPKLLYMILSKSNKPANLYHWLQLSFCSFFFDRILIKPSQSVVNEQLLIFMKLQQSVSSSESETDKERIPHARMSPIRFLLLFLLILVAFANQYTFNNPQALEDSMEEILEITQSEFQLFYSLYALPNVFTLFFIGYLCDLIGTRISLIVLSGGIAVFQLLIAIGGYAKSYSTILAGRILFGIASEAVFIPHASMISVWFQGTQQAFALGIGITFPELGNALNSFLTPLIFESSKNLGNPLMFSFGLCVFGFIMACLAAYIDKRADRIDEENNVQIVSHEEGESEQIKCEDIKKLRRQFWIVVSICTAAMSLWIPFMDNVNRMFQKRFCYTQVSAGNVITIAYIVAVVLSVPLGLAVDAFGQRRYLSILGLVVFFSAQFIMLVYPQCDGAEEKGVISGLILQGIGYAFYANVLVAAVPLVCKLNLLGTAFGIMEMLQSFFEFLIPIVTGSIVSSSSSPEIGYRISSAIFVVLGLIGIAIGSALFWGIKDHYKKKLDRSSAQNLLAVAKRKSTPHLVSSWSHTEDESYHNSPRKRDDPLRESLLTLQIPQMLS